MQCEAKQGHADSQSSSVRQLTSMMSLSAPSNSETTAGAQLKRRNDASQPAVDARPPTGNGGPSSYIWHLAVQRAPEQAACRVLGPLVSRACWARRGLAYSAGG